MSAQTRLLPRACVLPSTVSSILAPHPSHLQLAKLAEETYADVKELNAKLKPAGRVEFTDAFVKTMPPGLRGEARAANKSLLLARANAFAQSQSAAASGGGGGASVSSAIANERDLTVATSADSATDMESDGSPVSRDGKSPRDVATFPGLSPAAWWFQDGTGDVQGPCKHDHMLHWLQKGLLHATTLVTPASPSGEALSADALWHSLSEIVPEQAAAAEAVETAHALAESVRIAAGGTPPTHWWFQDSDGAVQGPCGHDEMVTWLEDGSLQPGALG